MPTETPQAVANEVRRVMNLTRPDDIIDGVKNAVTREIERLDPSVIIKRTEYFNHTYNPDLVVSWMDDGKSRSRQVFLRGSLGAVLDSNDLVGLAEQRPILIGLQQDKRKVSEDLRERVAEAPQSLATDLNSVAWITAANEPDAPQEATLSGLVRANLLRGGRGVLTSKDAHQIVAVEGVESASSLRAFQQTVTSLFVGETAHRLERTAGFLQAVLAAEPGAEALAQLTNNPLSDSELTVVLPYLLKRADSVRLDGLWEALGSMLTLERIEDMSEELSGLDLTDLVAPHVRSLTGTRAQLSASPDELTDEEFDARPAAWRTRSGMLSADVGRLSLYIASDGRKLKLQGREGGADARWDEISGQLASFDLLSVQLHGLSTQVDVSGEDPEKLRANVEIMRETIDDDFHVPMVQVREKGIEDAVTMDVRFAPMTVHGKGATVYNFVLSANLLARKRPFPAATIARLTNGVVMQSPLGADVLPIEREQMAQEPEREPEQDPDVD